MTKQEILDKVASGEIQPGEASTLLDAMNTNGKSNGQLSYKVSPKGAISAYGLGRFPTTLYVQQWERLDSDAERKRRVDFIKSNSALLTRKS